MTTQLPSYTSGVPLPVAQGPRASGFGIEGAALQRVGQAGEQVGQDVGNIAIRRARELQALETNDYVATQSADLTDKYHQQFLDQSENAPPGAKGFTEAFMKGYDDDLTARIKAAPSDQAKMALQDRGLSIRNALHANALTFERDAGKQQRQENVATSVSKLSNIAIGSPELYGDLKKQVEDTVNAYKADMTAQEFAKVHEAAQRTLATSAISGLVEKDPAGALKALGTGEFDDLIQPGDKLRLTASANAEIRRRDAEARQADREARADARAAKIDNQFNVRLSYQDELAAAADGKTVDPDLDKKIASTYDPPQAKAMLDHLHNVREEGHIAGQMATMTPDEIGKAVAGHAPEGPGYADEAASQDRLAQVGANVLAARLKDPAAEAARAFPDISAGLTSDDPAKVSAAVRKSLQVQRETFGLPEDQLRPLTKPAAAHAVEVFKGQGSADEKLAQLNSLTDIKKEDGTPDYGASRAVIHQLEAAGLPPGVDMALDAQARGDIGAARSIISAAALGKEVPKLTQSQGTGAANATKALREDPNTGVGVDSRVAAVTGEPDDVKASTRGEDMVHRLTALEVAAGTDPNVAAAHADKIVHGDGPVINDDVAAVRLPAGTDPGSASKGMGALRSNLDLSYYEPTPRNVGVGMKKTRLTEAEMDAIAKDPRYETKLTPEQEKAFQIWKAKVAPDDSGYDYDFRGAFLANQSPDPATQHWVDEYKKPNEPTFSTFSIYAKDRPDLAGTWAGEAGTPYEATYVPPGRSAGEVTGAYNLEKRKFDQWAEAVRNHGVFINHGDGYVLVPQVPGPSYGRPLLGPDGKPRVFSLDEVLKAGSAKPDVSGGMDWATGSGGAGADLLASAAKILGTRGQAGSQRLPPDQPAIPTGQFPPSDGSRQQPPQGDAAMRQLLGNVIGLKGPNWSH